MQLVNNQMPILLLGQFMPADEVGIFKAVSSCATFISFFLLAINTVIAPHFARLHAAADRTQLQRLVSVSTWAITGLSIPVFLLLSYYGRPILELLFGAAYSRGYTALYILAWGQLINAVCGSVALLLNMTGFERDTARFFMLSALGNAIMSFYLIPKLGIIGAALSSTASMAFWNISLSILVYRRIKIITIPIPLRLRGS